MTAALPAAAAAFLKAHPQVRAVDLLLPDLNGVLRGKRIQLDELAAIHHRGLFLPGSMFALDPLGGTIEASGLGFDEGDADRPCLPIPDSLHPCPWLGDGIAQLQVTMYDADRRPFYADPRHVLAGVIERYKQLGLTPVVALELEFYCVDRERAADGRAQPPPSPLTGRREYRTQINSMSDLDAHAPMLREIVDTCALQGVPAGTVLAEYGPSQWEVNLHHVADAMTAADHAVRLKRIVKGVALKHGREATFMAKPYGDMAGSGMHIHVSVLDADGNNVFASDEPDTNPQLRHAAAGLLATMGDAMAVFAPNANSYRRFRKAAYVPMHATWGYNNRGVAVRIPVSGATDRRLEHRVAGADANPYLLTAAVLAGIHHGLANRLAPPALHTGNAYRERLAATPLPVHWPAAIEQLFGSTVLRDYLGSRFVDLYVAVKRGELEDFCAHVTRLEHEWYLEPL